MNGLQEVQQTRRFVVVRERERERRATKGRKLIDVPGYSFRVFVTTRLDAEEEIWRDYNRRADMENRIAELKQHDFHLRLHPGPRRTQNRPAPFGKLGRAEITQPADQPTLAMGISNFAEVGSRACNLTPCRSPGRSAPDQKRDSTSEFRLRAKTKLLAAWTLRLRSWQAVPVRPVRRSALSLLL